MAVFKMYLKGIFVIFVVILASVLLFKMLKDVDDRIPQCNLSEPDECMESVDLFSDDITDSDLDYEKA